VKEVITITGTDLLTTLDVQIDKIGMMLSENPDDIGILIAYAEFHFRRGRYLEALQAYQKVVSIRQDISDVHLGLAKIYMRQNMIADAYSELLQVFEIMPHNIEGHIIFKKLKDLKEAPLDLQEAFARYGECEPDLDDLRLFKHQKELEMEKMEQEIAELGQIMADNEEEPIYEYNYEMAMIRKKGIGELFSYINNLETHLGEKAALEAEQAAHEAEKAALEAEKAALEAEMAAHEKEMAEIEAERLAALQKEQGELQKARELEELSISPELMKPDEGERAEKENATSGDVLEELPGKEGGSAFEGRIADILIMPEDDLPFEQDASESSSPESVEPAAAEDVDGAGEKASEKKGISEERLKFYTENKESVTTVMAGLIKTKGVTVVMTCARDGYVIDSIINETIDYEEIGTIVRAGVETIANWRPDVPGKAFLYWVLEFEQGLLVIRAVNSDHFLLAIAKAGANFGAMRFSMEKGKEALDELLSAVPSL
jgi:predicted regulator of Ras-like GTPase activity (Roadblock/LC7/MglB family)